MKKYAMRLVSVLAAMTLLTGSASALSFSGSVAAREEIEIYAPIGGTVEKVNVEAGQRVEAGDVIAELSTSKVYASEDGVVTGVFGAPGDSAETIAAKYGAVLYIEGDTLYTISASTEEAYNSTANKLVHVGEQVYLSCYSHGTHTGTGVITGIEGTNYSVDVTSGSFLLGETVSIFRGESATSSKRIGRGDIGRRNPVAVSGAGSIVSIAVADGDSVKKGDLLLETLDGSFDGLYMSGSQILSSVSGTIAQVNLAEGSRVEKDAVAAVIYPEGEVRVEAQVSEYNLSEIAVGDRVSVELLWNQDTEVSYDGEIAMISAVAQQGAEDEDACYTVYVNFTPDENTRYGMSAVVSTMDEIEGEALEEVAE